MAKYDEDFDEKKYNLFKIPLSDEDKRIESLLAEIDRLRKALEFYGDVLNWRNFFGDVPNLGPDTPHAIVDAGKVAREELNPKED